MRRWKRKRKCSLVLRAVVVRAGAGAAVVDGSVARRAAVVVAQILSFLGARDTRRLARDGGDEATAGMKRGQSVKRI